ncbi:MunI family type II restriction endonuclease [Sphingorhabdus sp.]|jgi:hypothetical protein|uniref:MunI family type II restriction endonuclease n=1 Tax=Sphingorhabdus sp. TaxID=1902408 RepID=UPI0037C583AB
MGTKELRTRSVWQDYSGVNAGIAEKNFFEVLNTEFKGSDFKVRSKPQEFKDVYVKVDLHPEVLGEIYTPDIIITKHGITPDYAIDNIRTQKTLYVEVKRQDGWVEGKPRSAGRGNAHERSCKYFTPGLLRVLRERGNLGESVLPFWTVFQGDISRDPCRVREITCWYEGHSSHFFMWRDALNATPLLNHFNTHLRPLLED